VETTAPGKLECHARGLEGVLPSALLPAGLERLHRLQNSPRACLGPLRLLDPADEALAIERRQGFEEAKSLGLGIEGVAEILRQCLVLRALGDEIDLNRRSIREVGIPTP